MLSILPKHVADEMLKDMKKDESQKDQQQFNTMYMYRHENVRCAAPTPGSKSGTGAGLHGSAVPCGVPEPSPGLEAGPPPPCEPQPLREQWCWPMLGLRHRGRVVQPVNLISPQGGEVTSRRSPSRSGPARGLTATLLLGGVGSPRSGQRRGRWPF